MKHDANGFPIPGPNHFPADFASGAYVMTASRTWVNALDPQPDQILIDDIAHALSRIERFGGHGKCHYSVADHCVVMARASAPEFALQSLLHDAAEAYIGDLIRPVKRQCNDFADVERRFEMAIAAAFGLETLMSDPVRELDNYMIKVESEELFGSDLRTGDKRAKIPHSLIGTNPGSLYERVKTHMQTYLTWEASRAAFLQEYHRIRERSRRLAAAR